jgi:hypothetical protein
MGQVGDSDACLDVCFLDVRALPLPETQSSSTVAAQDSNKINPEYKLLKIPICINKLKLRY